MTVIWQLSDMADDDMFGSDDEEQDNAKIAVRPASSGVLAFHNGTEEALYHYVKNKAVHGNAMSILKCIDEFCYTQHWMMHIGDQKLPLLAQSLQRAVPHHPAGLCIAELGSYCGYSAVYIASQLNVERGDHLYCIESEEKCVMWTRRMVALARLDNIVTVIHSTASNFDSWRNQLNSPHIDLLFIDHDKAMYLADLLRIEAAGLLHTGSVVVADNVLSFGVALTDYLRHVRDSAGLYSESTLHEGFIEYAQAPGAVLNAVTSPSLVDGVEISIFR